MPSADARNRRVLAALEAAVVLLGGDDEGRRFWGSAGAGVVFLAKDTGRLLLQHRSAYVNEPYTWGTWGGAIDSSESPEEAARREVREEASYHGALDLEKVWTFEDQQFRYTNFLAVVPHEFEPNHSWESQGHAWVSLDDLPSPLHFGFKALLPHLTRFLARHPLTVAAPRDHASDDSWEVAASMGRVVARVLGHAIGSIYMFPSITALNEHLKGSPHAPFPPVAGKIGYLPLIEVPDALRGHGLGSRVVARMLQMAHDDFDVDAVVLHAGDPMNPRSHTRQESFWSKQGFRKLRYDDGTYSSPPMAYEFGGLTAAMTALEAAFRTLQTPSGDDAYEWRLAVGRGSQVHQERGTAQGKMAAVMAVVGALRKLRLQGYQAQAAVLIPTLGGTRDHERPREALDLDLLTQDQRTIQMKLATGKGLLPLAASAGVRP